MINLNNPNIPLLEKTTQKTEQEIKSSPSIVRQPTISLKPQLSRSEHEQEINNKPDLTSTFTNVKTVSQDPAEKKFTEEDTEKKLTKEDIANLRFTAFASGDYSDYNRWFRASSEYGENAPDWFVLQSYDEDIHGIGIFPIKWF